MIKIEVIGNLGADAQLQVVNGNKFVSFRVANTDSWTDKVTGEIRKTTQWISCSLNGDGGSLLAYLKKGTKVFVRGNANMVTYSSPKTHQIEVGVNLYVREIELCGGKRYESRYQGHRPSRPYQGSHYEKTQPHHQAFVHRIGDVQP